MLYCLISDEFGIIFVVVVIKLNDNIVQLINVL